MEMPTGLPAHTQASINGLANEILLLIFKMIPLSCPTTVALEPGACKLSKDLPIWKSEEVFTPQDDPRSLTSFPYAPASVSIRWRNILLSEPTFWIRPIITVGSYRPLFQPSIEHHLALSRNLRIVVTVVCREDPFACKNSSEGDDVMALLPYIRRHRHRCFGLSIHLNRSSSLPSIPRHLRKTLASGGYDCLELKSKIDDRERDLLISFSLPSVVLSLVVDRSNFEDLQLRGIQAKRLVNVVISDWTAKPERNAPTLLSVLVCLRTATSMTRLTFKNVDIPLGEETYGTFPAFNPYMHHPSLNSINFEDLSNKFISAFFTFTYHVAKTRITRCSLPRYFRSSCTDDLTLEGIGADPNRVPFLGWRGHTLRFRDCPGLDDNTLLFMTGIRVNHLYITDCHHFSDRTLWMVLTTQIMLDDIANMAQYPRYMRRIAPYVLFGLSVAFIPLAMCLLVYMLFRSWITFAPVVLPLQVLSVHRGPVLDENIRKWFERHIDSVTWSQVDSKRYLPKPLRWREFGQFYHYQQLVLLGGG